MSLSPDADTFSTPPASPFDAFVRPSLSRKSSRPSSLRLDSTRTEWPNNIILETSGAAQGYILTSNETMTPTSAVPSSSRMDAQPISNSNGIPHQPMHSPCFVHSHLDKGASLTEWLRNKQTALIPDVGVAHSLQRNGINGSNRSDYQISSPPSSGSSSVISSSNDDDDEYGASLTKQLAETAVGVREMSKQLGRARVRSSIQNVLIITKARDNRLIKLTRELALYLMLKPRNGQQRGLVVYVDNQLRHSRRFDAESIERDHPQLFVPFPRRRTSSSTSLSSLASAPLPKEELYLKEEGQLRYWTSHMCSHSPHLFDFVVTLGGDGTVLFTSWLFQRIVPPVLPFALGSLGFLTNFDFADHQAVMDSAIDSGIRVNLRMRFTCTVYRAVTNESKCRKAVKKGETGEIMMRNIEKDGWEALEGSWSGGIAYTEGCKNAKDKEIMCFTTRPVETFEVLNDLVVDRGPSPFVSLLELFGDEHHMTTVQADGLTVSTPTGSTAYSLSAGGSLVHPEIPAILITPICPHTLSFRPMLLPDSMELRICVPFNSRSTAWASFDGRGRVELKQGDHIKVTASKYPFPTVCADKQSTDWFHAISRTLKWNERERQKSFVMVEEGPSKPTKRSKHRNASSEVSGTITPEVVQEETPEDEGENEETVEDEEEDEVSDEERDDGKFDIDDSSPEAAMSKALNLLGLDAETIGQEKAQEIIAEDQLHKALVRPATSVLQKEHKRWKSRSRSRSRARSHSRPGYHSGVETPGRYAGPEPHPPIISPRRVEFSVHGPSFHMDSTDSGMSDSGHRGARDDIHSSRRLSGKSRIPKDRDLDTEAIQTPTVGNLPYNHGHSRSQSRDASGHRAFAVWGQDESDSTTSDSDT